MTYIPKSYGAQDVEPTAPRHSEAARAAYADAPALHADGACGVTDMPAMPGVSTATDVQKTMVYPRPRAYQQAPAFLQDAYQQDAYSQQACQQDAYSQQAYQQNAYQSEYNLPQNAAFPQNAYQQNAYQQQAYTQDAYQQEPSYEQPAMYPQEPRTQARVYQPQAAPRYDVPQTSRYASPQPAASPQRLQRAAVPSPQRPQHTPALAHGALNTVSSVSPSELLSALPFPLRHTLAFCCIALAWCLRMFSWAQVAVCVVSMIGFGPLRALVMYANLAVQSLVPQFLLGYAVIPTVFGGVLRGDLVFVAVLCACFDFLLQKLAYRLRQ